jgi:hypothetical protein
VRLKEPEMRYSPFTLKLIVESGLRVTVEFAGVTFPYSGTGANEVRERTTLLEN